MLKKSSTLVKLDVYYLHFSWRSYKGKLELNSCKTLEFVVHFYISISLHLVLHVNSRYINSCKHKQNSKLWNLVIVDWSMSLTWICNILCMELSWNCSHLINSWDDSSPISALQNAHFIHFSVYIVCYFQLLDCHQRVWTYDDLYNIYIVFVLVTYI